MSEGEHKVTVKIVLDVTDSHGQQLHSAVELIGAAKVVARAGSAVAAAVIAAIGSDPIEPTVITPTEVAAAAESQGVAEPLPGAVVHQPTLPTALLSPAPKPSPKSAPAPILASTIAPTAPLSAMSVSAQSSHRQMSRQSVLAQRDWSKFSLSFGALLVVAALAVAVIFPPLVPREQRLEVFMMSLAFGLLGTLSLYSGALPGKGVTTPPIPAKSMAQVASTHDRATAERRAALLRARTAPSIGASLWGMAFGGVFVVAGLIAPLALGTGDADERFLMMLGFAPVVAVGILLIVIFLRRMQKPAAKSALASAMPMGASSATPRAPVSRAPTDVAFRFGVPAALAALGVVLLLVIGLVAVATLLPMLR